MYNFKLKNINNIDSTVMLLMYNFKLKIKKIVIIMYKF